MELLVCIKLITGTLKHSNEDRSEVDLCQFLTFLETSMILSEKVSALPIIMLGNMHLSILVSLVQTCHSQSDQSPGIPKQDKKTELKHGIPKMR